MRGGGYFASQPPKVTVPDVYDPSTLPAKPDRERVNILLDELARVMRRNRALEAEVAALRDENRSMRRYFGSLD